MEVVVEALCDGPAHLDEHEGAWNELQAAVRRVSREMIEAHGACRIEAELSREGPTRFHVFALPAGKKAPQREQEGW